MSEQPGRDMGEGRVASVATSPIVIERTLRRHLSALSFRRNDGRDVATASVSDQQAWRATRVSGHIDPSVDVTPSPEDRAFTRRIVEAGTMLGLRVLDHLVVSDERYFSFLDSGELGSRS